MGGPIDARRSPTAVNGRAQERGQGWPARDTIAYVPPLCPGAWRRVYPGFPPLSGFMAMNLDRHVAAHADMFDHLVTGDGDSAEKRRESVRRTCARWCAAPTGSAEPQRARPRTWH